MKEFPMKSNTCGYIHRIKYDKRKVTPRKSRETRSLLGSRFKVMLADAGLSPEETGKLLHVTARTVRYWISGQVAVPYAAYRLVRVMRFFELPTSGWDGWHMHSGKLWSPEGHGFAPMDATWWSLLVRKAHCFHTLYQRSGEFERALMMLTASGLASASSTTEAGRVAGPAGVGAQRPSQTERQRVPTGEAGRAAKPPGLNLSIEHNWTTWTRPIGINGLQAGEKLVVADRSGVAP